MVLQCLLGTSRTPTSERSRPVSDDVAADVPHPELDGLTPREAAVNKFQCVACERALERLGSEWSNL